MRHVSPVKAGISAGAVIALWHLLWVTLVAVGWAKPLMDLILRLHFIKIEYALIPFTLGVAAMLVAITFAIGFIIGLLFALVWNWLGDSSKERIPSA